MNSLNLSQDMSLSEVREVVIEWETQNKSLDSLIKEAKGYTDNEDSGNPLYSLPVDHPFNDLRLFFYHLILFGWPDSEEDLKYVIDLILDNSTKSTYKEIIDFWGVEGCCVLGSKECSDIDSGGEVDLNYKFREGIPDSYLKVLIEMYNQVEQS